MGKDFIEAHAFPWERGWMEEMDSWSINDLSASTWNNDKHIRDAHWILFLLFEWTTNSELWGYNKFHFYDDIVHNVILILYLIYSL